MSNAVVESLSVLDWEGRGAVCSGRLTRVSAVRGSEVFVTEWPGTAWDAVSVVPLPVIGERVAVMTTSGLVEGGAWLGLTGGTSGDLSRMASADGSLGVWLLVGEQVRTVRVQPDGLDARKVVTGTLSDGERAAVAVLAALQRTHAEAMTKHEQWLAGLVSDAHDYANDNDLCGRFDEFMTEHGLPGRVREFRFRVNVQSSVYLTVEGADAEAAQESITREQVWDAMSCYGIDEWEAEED